MSEKRHVVRRVEGRSADVARGRATIVAVAVALVLTLAATFAAAARSGGHAVGPLSRPHVKNGVACASCHTQGEDKPATCGGCHDPKLHVSTRAGHRAQMQKGTMTCATCHPAHGDAYGVTFTGDDAAVLFRATATKDLTPRISAPKGTTVPLVKLDRCAGCHASNRPDDPIARCKTKGGFSSCFEEHDTTLVARAATGVCGKQHSATRYVAWEAASSVMDQAPPDLPPRTPWSALAGAAGLGLFGGLFSYVLVARRRRATENVAGALAPEKKRLPVIDPATCLGCNACVDVCPFDVIEMERYVAKVVRAEECCGVILCEQVCPNGSLVIRESDAVPPGPRIDPHGESVDTPGVFVAGDLTGLPLIKNAIAQGARTIDRIAAVAKERRRGSFDVDVAIVGAGPAGLSAALSAKASKLRARTFEQGEIAASIRSFPRDKLVYDAPLTMPVEGPLMFEESTKEELVLTWTRLVRKHDVKIEARTRVTAVEREGDGHRITIERASGESESLSARFVVFATGKHGTPRPFEAEITEGARAHVHRFLADAKTFTGKRVLVVGLGDSAIEAALALAKQPGTHVTIAHRGDAITRGKKRNVDELRHLVDTGALTLLLAHRVRRVSEGLVELVAREEVKAIEADAVLVLIGGEPAWPLLERAGLSKHQIFSPEEPSKSAEAPEDRSK